MYVTFTPRDIILILVAEIIRHQIEFNLFQKRSIFTSYKFLFHIGKWIGIRLNNPLTLSEPFNPRLLSTQKFSWFCLKVLYSPFDKTFPRLSSNVTPFRFQIIFSDGSVYFQYLRTVYFSRPYILSREPYIFSPDRIIYGWIPSFYRWWQHQLVVAIWKIF